MNRFLSALKAVEKPVVHVVEKVGIKTAEIALEDGLPVAANFFPILAPLVPLAKSAGAYLDKKGGQNVNQLEAFAITLILGMLQQTVKNPAHRAALGSQLLGVASDIFLAYGVVPPDTSEAIAALTPPAKPAAQTPPPVFAPAHVGL